MVKVELDGKVVKGSLRCIHIPNKAQPTLTKHIAAPSSEDAAEFQVEGCVQ